MSPCNAMRLRSRQENCATGVSPFATRTAAAAALDMWQFAPAPSVMLMASARSRKRDARAISTPESAGVGRRDLDGDDETPRPAGLLEAEALARRRHVRPDDGRSRMRAVDYPQP